MASWQVVVNKVQILKEMEEMFFTILNLWQVVQNFLVPFESGHETVISTFFSFLCHNQGCKALWLMLLDCKASLPLFEWELGNPTLQLCLGVWACSLDLLQLYQ